MPNSVRSQRRRRTGSVSSRNTTSSFHYRVCYKDDEKIYVCTYIRHTPSILISTSDIRTLLCMLETYYIHTCKGGSVNPRVIITSTDISAEFLWGFFLFVGSSTPRYLVIQTAIPKVR